VTSLYIGSGVLLIVLLALWVAYAKGKAGAEGDAAKKAAEVKDAQLKVDRPSRDDVLGSLHDHDF
jgi:hypothetical protein